MEKSEIIRFRISQSDKELISQGAQRAGMSMSDFSRLLLTRGALAALALQNGQEDEFRQYNELTGQIIMKMVEAQVLSSYSPSPSPEPIDDED